MNLGHGKRQADSRTVPQRNRDVTALAQR